MNLEELKQVEREISRVTEGTRDLDKIVADTVDPDMVIIGCGLDKYELVYNDKGGCNGFRPLGYKVRDLTPLLTTHTETALSIAEKVLDYYIPRRDPGLRRRIFAERLPTHDIDLWIVTIREHGADGVEGSGRTQALATISCMLQHLINNLQKKEKAAE